MRCDWILLVFYAISFWWKKVNGILPTREKIPVFKQCVSHFFADLEKTGILDLEEHLLIRPIWGTFWFIERIFILFPVTNCIQVVDFPHLYVPHHRLVCFMLTFCILRLYIIVLGHYINENNWGTLGSHYSGSEEHPALFPGLHHPIKDIIDSSPEHMLVQQVGPDVTFYYSPCPSPWP